MKKIFGENTNFCENEYYHKILNVLYMINTLTYNQFEFY